MTWWCCITPERETKTRMIMEQIQAGWPGASMIVGWPPRSTDPFITWGQVWLAEELIRRALKNGTPFWQIDNAFFKPARGGPVGYYRFMYCRPDPVFVKSRELRRARMQSTELWTEFAPWRRSGKHVLIAMPGLDFGRAFGIDVPSWTLEIADRVRQNTDRPIVVRDRFSKTSLEQDLKDAWAVVTHSSNVGVDAVRAGIPVFVEPTSMCAPLGNLDLKFLETPATADRGDWWASLMCQQFTLGEMRSGLGHYFLSEVAAQHARDAARGNYPGWQKAAPPRSTGQLGAI